MAKILWRGFFKRDVLAETKDGSWTFKFKGGLFKRRYSILKADSGMEAATMFREKTTVLNLTNGRQFFWKRISFWSSQYQWLTPQGEVLMRYSYKRKRLLKWQKQVFIERTACNFQELPLLVVLGLFLLRIIENESATIVAATSGASA